MGMKELLSSLKLLLLLESSSFFHFESPALKDWNGNLDKNYRINFLPFYSNVLCIFSTWNKYFTAIFKRDWRMHVLVDKYKKSVEWLLNDYYFQWGY